ncbi:hypothetical protein BOQ63_000580 (plasmid) [Streptomyces viridifaciens]|nr:hypothetical protein BOQ63_000580 [Streptomyces viridifaciens]
MASIALGAPATALVLEKLTALGTPAATSVGTAAALRRELPPGSLDVRDRALPARVQHP